MDIEKRFQSLLDLLKERGNRLTPQRVAIIRALVMDTGHPSAETIHATILKDFPTTSLATVYKTIKLLKDAGQMLELGFGENPSRYDGRVPFPHPHLICTRCGAIVDSHLDDMEATVQALAKQAGFTVQNHRFDIFGLCPDCQK